MDNLLPRLPFADWIDNGVDWLVTTFGTVFDGIADFLAGIVEGSVEWLDMVPSILLAVLFSCSRGSSPRGGLLCFHCSVSCSSIIWAIGTRCCRCWRLYLHLYSLRS